jgi:alpha-beta hydrolase superfamily lysophospholipase
MSERIWDEPAGATPRGTLILLPGRGETPTSYQRFGRRMAADAYKVRYVDVDLTDLAPAQATVEKLLSDATLPAPKVLVGSDAGATLAATLVNGLAADAAVIAGIALPGASTIGSWEDQLDARTACPTHRQVLDHDHAFDRGALGARLPWADLEVAEPAKPVLVLHGTADTITSTRDVGALYGAGRKARIRLVNGGRHDILNDLSHRSVAATIVLFLESLRIAPDLPDIVTPPPAKAAAAAR